MRAKRVYEFLKTGDIKSSLSIGTRSLIIKWLDEMGVEDYVIDKDFTIDLMGDTDLSGKDLSEIPEYIKFGKAFGDFYCMNSNIRTLEGWCPRIVNGDFSCAGNLLESLNGSPTSVGGRFLCDNNKLISLKGMSKNIGLSIFIDNNKELLSLKGMPKIVKDNFSCENTGIKDLIGGPEHIKGSLDCEKNHNLVSLEGLPHTIGDHFFCRNNGRKFSVSEIKSRCKVNKIVNE